ncbi:MAG: FkbM family methyltransferase [Burkholderiales bacterium]
MIAPNWRTTQIDEEHHMRRLLKYLAIDCVFDVGANVGQHAEKLRRYCEYSGLILSFEPNPAALPQLRAAASKDPRWEVFPIALGKEKGSAQFQAYEDSKLGSLLQFDAASPHSPSDMMVSTIQVDVETLADLYPALQEKYGFKRPFLKLDTQGFDLQAAMGAAKELKQFLGIQSEVTFAPIYDGAPKFDEVIACYESHGFCLSRLFPNNDVHFPQMVEMDVVMIRADQVKR